MKLDFWNMVVAQDSLTDVCSYWLPAFFSPQSFLGCLAQSRARNEEIPLDELLVQYEVQPFMAADAPCSQPHSVYMHGLWLEGADWDGRDRCLVETTKQTRFVQFPVIKLSIVLSSELSPAARRQTTALIESTGSLHRFKTAS